ncbi:hypothetical protein FOZ60_007881 [Perkinsus olseni]|uniref:Uncharacterized protein n=1 Tax=Perkinsus olseni TaxID=32597 RepID=A0A7J6NKI7_PEROL|nr:hypothetical protein FOZ60_007881 [Perkinsus olseni]
MRILTFPTSIGVLFSSVKAKSGTVKEVAMTFPRSATSVPLTFRVMISTRGKRWEVSFADGYEVEYVQHNVTLSIGGKVVPDFELGLIVEFDNTDGIEMTPDGLLGLSGGRSNIPETFLEQLKRRRVISRSLYTRSALRNKAVYHRQPDTGRLEFD